MLKWFLSVATVGAIAYILICLGVWRWQNRMIFFPSYQIERTPGEVGVAYEDVWIPISNPKNKEERLHGWWLPANSPNSCVLLYLHGNGSNISANLEQALRFQRLGFSVLIIDYRGYGLSQGNFPTEKQVYYDAQLAWNYLVQQREIKPQNIFLYGHSIGGAIAIDLGVRNPEVAGLIVEGSFTSMGDMIDHREMYRFLPINLLLNHSFDSLSKIQKLQSPLLLIHGTDDTVVPAKMSQVLFDAATVPKKLLFVPDADHNNVASVGENLYLQSVRDFYQIVTSNSHCK